MKNTLYIVMAGCLLFAMESCRKGCTDPLAENYDARAKKMDNSCEYDTTEPTSGIQLKVTHMLGTANFAFNQDFVDDFGNDCQFTRAEMYVSSPVYKDDQMNVITEPAAYALINPNEQTYAFGTVPGETHVHMMDLLVGVDEEANGSDPATYDPPSALAYQSPSMHWNWNSGYIFIAIEGIVDIDDNGTYDAGETFVMHVGTNALAATNSGLMAHFNSVTGQVHNIELEVDWKGLLTGIDLSTDNSTHTMDNMPLATTVSNNAASVISIKM